MKFTIEVDEFWLDGDDDLEPKLKYYITNSVVRTIQDSIKDRVEKQVEVEVKRRVEEMLYQHITAAIKEQIQTGNIKGRYSNSEPVTIANWIKEQFEASSPMQSLQEEVKKIAAACAKGIKDQYDLLFASQIVHKMSENGFLKDDVGRLLLPQAGGQ